MNLNHKFDVWNFFIYAYNIFVSLWQYHSLSILCFILHRTVDHRLVKTIGQFVYSTVQVNLKMQVGQSGYRIYQMWDNRD